MRTRIPVSKNTVEYSCSLWAQLSSCTPRRIGHALYQTDSTVHQHASLLTALQPLEAIPEPDRALFKSLDSSQASHVLTCRETIFHAQGGGQPSDEGTISLGAGPSGGGNTSPLFNVALVRHSATAAEDILHAGNFSPPSTSETFEQGVSVTQHIDPAKRALYSRLHTAGHLIGLAVRKLANAGELPGVTDEGKARHFPGSANVECTGNIPETMKSKIEEVANDFVKRDLEVDIKFWDKEKCRGEGIWGVDDFKGDTVRVVDVVGEGAYMCGGTHLPKTKDVGEIVVLKIKRSKGISKIGYDIKPY